MVTARTESRLNILDPGLFYENIYSRKNENHADRKILPPISG
jgi:hypothetical protein